MIIFLIPILEYQSNVAPNIYHIYQYIDLVNILKRFDQLLVIFIQF